MLIEFADEFPAPERNFLQRRMRIGFDHKGRIIDGDDACQICQAAHLKRPRAIDHIQIRREAQLAGEFFGVVSDRG